MTSGQAIGGGIILIIVSIVMIIWSPASYTPLTLQDTQTRMGILADDPVFDETGGETHKDYIEVSFVGNEKKYRFIDCSYQNSVVDKAQLLTKGDSLVLLVEDDYYIRQAWSPTLDTILSFRAYNNCDRYMAEEGIPKIFLFFLLIGVAIIVNALIQSWGDDRFMDIPKSEIMSITLPLEMQGDAITFILRNAVLLVLLFGFGIRNIISEDSDDHRIGYILTGAGIVFLVRLGISGLKRKYTLDEEGIRASVTEVLGGVDTTKIKYEDVDEVLVRAGLIERWRGLGSLRIVREKKEGEDDPVEIHVHGIPNANQVARIINDIASAKRAGRT